MEKGKDKNPFKHGLDSRRSEKSQADAKASSGKGTEKARAGSKKTEKASKSGGVQLLERDCDALESLCEQQEPQLKNKRQNVRVPVSFGSFIYPVSGRWKGRCAITSVNLSSCGICFYCFFPLEKDEVVEIVIPVTKHPLLLKCRILEARRGPGSEPWIYSAQFVGQLEEEISLVREAVYGIQMRNKKKEGKKGTGKNGKKG